MCSAALEIYLGEATVIREVSRLANEEFDLLVVGGGITGACIARDAALRGLKVALIDKNDFSGATSANNSKLIHGGLRYLRNLELGQVRESLRERRIWQRNAPHLVQPLPFIVPLIDAGLLQRAILQSGLTLYDLLSYDRRWLDDPHQHLPGHSWLSSREARDRESVLDTAGLEGGFVYYDAQMYSPERLALECVIDATAHGAAAANYVTAVNLTVRDGRITGCDVRENFSQTPFHIAARQTVVAAGPWSDLFLEAALGKPAPRKLKRSKGIHVIVPARTSKYALTVAAEDTHFFVLPWRGHTLLGTTDTVFTKVPDDVDVTQSDIEDFFAFMMRHLPTLNLSREDVEHAYAGLRPLVDDGMASTYKTSRRAEIVDHREVDGLEGLVSVIGGKWTGSRCLAEKAVNVVARNTRFAKRKCATATTVLPGGRIGPFLEFERGLSREHPRISDVSHIARLYGASANDMMRAAEGREDLLNLAGSSGDIMAEVIYAIRSEMALTLRDVIMRRTGIGQFGLPAPPILDAVSRTMAAELGWNETHRVQEIDAAEAAFRIRV